VRDGQAKRLTHDGKTKDDAALSPSRDRIAYVGIHDFQEGLHWSPDSRRIALIDCTYDWTPNHPATLVASDGRESGRRCSLAVVDRS
jgi:hypothetical protein